jgi:molybdopterin-guanine dinucleotide biosynthesis protein A
MKNIDTIIVAGGKSQRLNFVDKLELKIQDETILNLVINDAPKKTIVVGKQRNTQKEVIWVEDLFPDTGPAAGVWSGLQKVESEYVLLLAGDQPFLGEYVSKLCENSQGDGCWLMTADKIGQPLASCVRVSVLKNLLEESKGVNASLRVLLGTMDLLAIEVSDDVVQDLDTWSDVAKVMRERGSMTDAWLKNIADKLKVDHEILDIDKVLDLTREVAHNIERKAAPLTTFLLGYAAGKSDLTKEQIKELITKIDNSISEWKEKK